VAYEYANLFISFRYISGRRRSLRTPPWAAAGAIWLPLAAKLAAAAAELFHHADRPMMAIIIIIIIIIIIMIAAVGPQLSPGAELSGRRRHI
jgi:hypothetical protein